MSVLINPGSGPVADGLGWSNTVTTAARTASEWLERMHADGLTDVELLTDPLALWDGEGRWTFHFRHKVTQVVVKLSTHGVDNIDAYCANRLFAPRVYWNGSSSAEPQLDDFAAPGFVQLKTFVPIEGEST